MKRPFGFTLIELLIVVAIIAILAAIAVPNFLEAQTRAKVSRIVSDLRSLQTAVETYRIDNNKAPADYNTGSAGGDPPPHPEAGNVSGVLHPGYILGGKLTPGLTTPIAYITDCWIRDPFVGKTESFTQISFDQQVYTYNPMIPLWGRKYPSGSHQYWVNNYRDHYGEYRLGSIGPDRDWYNGSTYGSRRHTIVYDASNGTISIGNIWRSQKNPEVKDRPPSDRHLL